MNSFDLYFMHTLFYILCQIIQSFCINFILMVSAFSVPKSKREHKYNDVPGPGQYNPQSSPKLVKQSDPKYSFGKQGRKHTQSFVPGPGSYEHKDSYTVDKNPSYSMLGRKQLKDSRIQLGPGQYQPKFTYAKEQSPAYSMKGRSYSTLQNKPGPGQYQYKAQLIKKGGIVFGKDSRLRQSDYKIPGPGSYDHEKAVFKYGSKQEPSYGFGSRLEIKNSSYVPGPGQYQQKKQLYSKIGGIISRDMSSSLILSKTPGPGSYNENSFAKIKSKDPQWSMSKSIRDDMSKSNPLGPGQYQHDKNYKSVIESSPRYQFGGNKRGSDYANYVPGPGSYDHNLLKSRKSIKIGQKTKELSGFQVPGPGNYEAAKYDNDSWLKGQGRYSLGKSSRDLNNNNLIPGPGTYQRTIIEPKGKVTFGKDGRRHESNQNPGPGHYDLKPHFADVPKYLLPNKN